MAHTSKSVPKQENTGLDVKKPQIRTDWIERLQHYVESTHDAEIQPTITQRTKPKADWTEKSTLGEDFIWGAGQSRTQEVFQRRPKYHRGRSCYPTIRRTVYA